MEKYKHANTLQVCKYFADTLAYQTQQKTRFRCFLCNYLCRYWYDYRDIIYILKNNIKEYKIEYYNINSTHSYIPIPFERKCGLGVSLSEMHVKRPNACKETFEELTF